MSEHPPVDAVLLLAFGGPERMQDVRPFLDNVLRGKPVPPERYEEVVHHYEVIGGRSPLRELTERQAVALTAELQRRGLHAPVSLGMRHWHPYIGETLAQLADAGVRRVVAPILSAFDSPASRQAYEAVIADQCAALGTRAPEVSCVSGLGTREGFVQANAERITAAIGQLGPQGTRAQLIFTAHSIPEAAARRSPYVQQYRACAAAVADLCGVDDWTLAYQSRSGSPQTPWLGPDIVDVLPARAGEDARAQVVAPIGFVCDHVEVLYDLDVEAAQLAAELGLTLVRAGAAGDHPAFVSAIADAVVDAAADSK